MPRATHISCLTKIENDEPESAYDVTLEAESTITRPSPSSSALAEPIR